MEIFPVLNFQILIRQAEISTSTFLSILNVSMCAQCMFYLILTLRWQKFFGGLQILLYETHPPTSSWRFFKFCWCVWTRHQINFPFWKEFFHHELQKFPNGKFLRFFSICFSQLSNLKVVFWLQVRSQFGTYAPKTYSQEWKRCVQICCSSECCTYWG